MTWVFFILIYIQKAPQLAQIKLQEWSSKRAKVSNNNCNAAMLLKILKGCFSLGHKHKHKHKDKQVKTLATYT